ncbi:uncharacterized protein LOC127517431 isoform X15 [Ctenopharyngodon idella]|uniref:uncharacterized protein LOC127517431 isoform X14 n=1 Tax=Ctenopharyngodon idella TaxID=7959 RepID=UPI00222E9A03|nr:uncharacterized protein LOC127517431 isoform X14 [Ctenopharyngodon idella]XP_051759002.1 uncharacterized protein LOC127517431 isoform X15 [Ctenopharyngodon idella]
MCIKKGMKISSANITTVCLSNSSQTNCKCENQYAWRSEQCSKYGACNPSQNGTCGCIASLPTDGAFCRPPPASLKLFKYTIDIKINASREAVIESLRGLIRRQKFPMCVKKGMKISSANITTVCLSNLSQTKCKCENQYAWRSEQCSKHGACNPSQNGTCGCIASLPTDGAFCRPPPAPLKSFKYTIDIKINASREAAIERLRGLIRRQKFPMCIKKGMKISSANITAVCLSNSSQAKCKCENQYAWRSEQCSKHGACNPSQKGTCGCIASLPTDGAFCRPPPAPLKSFKYTIDIKINASREAVIEHLRSLIRGQKFPMCIKKRMKISSANITTVCLSNSSQTKCKCENQYAWRSEQCSKHGACSPSQNGTCGCIASLPTDGAFCRPPPASLKLFKYTIDIKINASREAVIERLRGLICRQNFPMCIKKGMKISSANITTVCLSNSSKTECKCENHYAWHSEQFPKHGICGHSQNGTCGHIASLPADGAFCRPPPALLKLFKYTIDIKINASREAVIERLRGLIRRQKFPMCVKKGTKISSANIITVCLSNLSQTNCKCENQYAWRSEQCSKHGACSPSQNGTCECIASLPTDGAFCRPPPAPLKLFKYTIDIKINASREAVIERLRPLIHGQKFPMCIKKGMKISSAHITTVCLSNSSQTKCKCENQYAWRSEQCSKYGACSPSQNGTCGCIASLPTDGAFCRPPPAPLKLFKYTIDIKINASREAVIEHLRGLIRRQKFPMCVKKGMKISSANITTACLSNSSQTKCKCENQYAWRSEQCSKHGACSHSQNGTCRCIASVPTDRAFCQPPPAPLKLFKYTIDIKINASREAVIERLRGLIRGQKFPMCVKKGMKISSANITAVCLSNLSQTKCKCENQYAWRSEQCSKHGACNPSQNGICGCIASLPTDGAFCRPTPASLKLFKYTIDIKINASREAVIERLRGLIRGQKFPMCVKKGMKISSANITAVCLSNSSQTKCKCENQYAWRSEQCSKHGACNPSQNGTCGCIASLPSDGAFCRPPPAPLKSFKYTIDIKINASREAVIERLRALIRGQKFPMCIKKGMKISSANFTAVCLSNSSQTECKCENQYAWRSEQCSKHGACNPSQNGTCGCIASLPTDGAFCQPPPAPLKLFKYTIDIKINTSREAVIERLRGLIRGQKFPTCIKKGMKISSANITAVCLSNSSKTECKCENQYAWPSEQFPKHGICGHSQNGTCGCIASLPTDGAFCRPPPASLKLFKYTIDIKINASREAVIERLRGLIRGQKFPMCVKKGMKISSANITAVCLSNSSQTKCKCENQYAWRSEQCSKHGACSHSQNGTCGCIASLPTDGAFCRPTPAPLKSFKYTIDIKINASREAVIERLRGLIRGQKFPMCVKKGIKISSANISTVCLSNSSQTECKCENQYAWRSEQCSKHGACSPSQNGTCGCIASLPTDGAFCRPPPAQLKSFKYTIDIKINASREAVIERLRGLIRGQKFPMCFKKGMKISSAHITTVCLSNSSQTKCKCENQYAWRSEQCSKYGACSPSQNGTCGCIASLPTDGAFCRPPPAPLKLFKYTIDIKINASREAVIEHLRGLIRRQKFPMCVKKGMKISSANITTACLSNSSQTKCKCENQYAWRSEQCSKHGACSPSQNGTCGCIASVPTDGAFCQPPPAPLKLFKYTIDIKINASREAVIERLRGLIRGQKFPTCIKKGMKISSANITAVCLSNSSKTECKCENQYAWPSEQFPKHGICGPSQNGTCGCIASLPTDGAFCRPPPASLKLFKYTIDIKINASREAVIERLRGLIRRQKFPMCVKKGMKISSANITAVCLSNSSQTKCKCENQYAWRSEQCSKHGACSHSQNGTCGCIASLPTDGAFCRPTPAPLKSFKYTIDIKINASREAVIERLRGLIRGQKFPMCVKKGIKISSANISTVCLSNSSQTECKCENQYAWRSEQCSKHGACSPSQNGTCGCIASLPTDGAFCRPPPAPLKSFKYTIDIKINASREAVIERLRGLIRGQKFPMCFKKGMKISSANITAVCLSNSSQTKCKCENQYAWPSEQCSKHGACSPSQNGTCGCIASLPTDGAFCQPPPAPLKSFKYTIDIKINASREAVMEHLRGLIRGQKFPMCVKKGIKISSANITAVCLSNSSQTECKCENQYAWPSEQCFKHGVCDDAQNSTCRCIASLPADGTFCRPPPASLKSFKYTIDIKINASREAMIEHLRALICGQKFPMCVKKGMKISSANITTVCLSNSSHTECKCENQYAWPSEQCFKHGACGHSQNGTCGCIASLPTDGAFCRPPPGCPIPSTTIPNTSVSITSTPSVPTATNTDVTTLTTPILNTTREVTTITSSPSSTPVAEMTNVTSLSTLIPNTTDSTAMTSAPASTPTIETTNVTSLPTLIPNTTDSTTITSAPASTPTIETSVTSLPTLIPSTTDSTTITSAPASTPTVETTNVTSHSTLIPSTTDSTTITSAPASTPAIETTIDHTSPNTTDSTTITSAPASTPKEQTPNVTSLPTLIPNTTDSTAMTSAPASTPTIETTNVTSLPTLIPNTTDSTAITSASASTPAIETTNVTSLPTLIPNTTDSTTITSTPASTPAIETTNVTSLSTLIPNTTDSTTITSAPASTPTVETNVTSLPTLIPNTTYSTAVTNVTSLSTLIPNTTDSTTIKSAPASTPTVVTTKFTTPSTPNTTKITTAVTSALTSTSTTGTSQSTTTKPPPSTVLTTKAPTAPPPPPPTEPPTTKSITVIPTKPLITTPTTARMVTTIPATTVNQVNRQISLSIDETFDASLKNQNSDKFKKYKSDIEKAIHSSYKDVKGFISATVTGFRPGSVIVDFFITSAEAIQISGEINQAIYTNMKELNFKVDQTSIAETENTDLRSRDIVFPEKDMKLSCPATSPLGNVVWKFQGNNIQPSNHYEFSSDHLTLTVKSVTISDNGRYECLYNTTTGPHITWDRIDYIKPYPNMQVPTNKTYKCENQQVDVICCVHSDYNIQWVQNKKMLSNKADSLNCITQPFTISSESSCGTKSIFTCKLDNKDLLGFSYSSRAVELVVVSNLLPPNSPVTCFDEVYGFGQVDERKVGDCEKNKVGYLEGVCQSNGLWKTINNNCVLRIIDVLQEESKVVDPETLTDFVIKVSNATTVNKVDIVQSQATVSTIVEILNNIADVSQNVTLDEVVVTNFLNIVDVISSETTKPVWAELNSNGASQGNSSQLLSAIENVIKATSDSNFNITSPSNSFLFKKVTTSENFRDVLRLNSTAEIFIPDITSTHKNITITAVAFSSLGNVMPGRNRTDNLNKTENVINGLIVVVNTSISINNIELSFEKRSNSVTQNNNSVNLGNPQCVFWEFNLFNQTGGWDSTGCEIIRVNGTVTCHCNHTTSFSILMSPFAPEDLALSVITYVGVAISIASLVVCLIIEMIIWKDVSRNSTSHVRHVSLVNIALSLLIADICFIIGAAVAKPGEDYTSSCSAVVFFTHFFYLALFFWMLVSALLLLYRTTVVFSQISKSVMMAVAFILGYGAPVLISVITVASTAGSKKYVTQNGTCWLNWDDSRALLAFVLPALVIVLVNIIVVIIVIVKMLRRGVGESNSDERKVLVVILRCVAILTPLFGITWGLGLGIMIEPKALAIHYLFTIFNSLQGFLILVLGTLMEKKVRQALKTRLSITRLTGSRVTHSSRSGAQSYSSSNRTTLTDVFNTLLRRGRTGGANINSSYNTRSSEGFLNA